MNTRTEADILTAQLTIEAHCRGVEEADLPAAALMLNRALDTLRGQDAAPTIPACVREISTTRNAYPDRPMSVSMSGAAWSVSFLVHEDHLFNRIADIAEMMEGTK